MRALLKMNGQTFLEFDDAPDDSVPKGLAVPVGTRYGWKQLEFRLKRINRSKTVALYELKNIKNISKGQVEESEKEVSVESLPDEAPQVYEGGRL